MSAITEAEATAWLVAKAREHNCRIQIETVWPEFVGVMGPIQFTVLARGVDKSVEVSIGASLEKAVVDARAKLAQSAPIAAAAKRSQAAKLLSEAELLEESAEERADIDRERDNL